MHSAYIIAETLRRGAKVGRAERRKRRRPTEQHFAEVEIDTTAFQAECTPSYFSNEGQKDAPWQLFRAYGLGWDAFQTMLGDWRAKGKMEGLELTG